MKKAIIPILMLCIGHASMMRAADTDVSAIANVVYVEPFEASPGATELELSIKMKNTAAIRGFQFDLVLPEGVTPVEDEGDYVYWLNNSRAPKKGGGQFYHTLEVSKQSDGSYRFLSGSTADKTFNGEDGEMAVILVNIAAGMAIGDYTITLKNIKLTETDINNYYETASVESTLTISNSPRIILNEASTLVPVAATGANVKVKRKINADEWSTICLPFDMSSTEVKTAFGDGVQLKTLSSWSFEGSTPGSATSITLNFTDATTIEKNKPYLIKVADKVTEFVVDNVTIDPADNPSNSVTSTNGSDYTATMRGVYTTGKVEAKDLFLSENMFWYSAGNTAIKAFRATFNFGDVVLSSYNDGGSARMTMTFDDETTGISEVVLPQSVELYNMNGQQVKTPAKGLYIKNGKKTIIK